MVRAEPRPTWAIELFAQRAGGVIQFVTPAPLQFGHGQIDKIDEGSRRHRVGQIETVYVGLFDPGDQFVRYLFGRATTGPRPPIAACFAISRTVHTRAGSAIVHASSAEVCASCRLWRSGSSSPYFEKSTPVQPDISTSAPSSLG